MRRLPILLVLGAFLAGCPLRVDYGSYGRIDDPAVVLRTLRRHQDAVHGLAGEGKLAVESPGGSGTLRVAIEVAQPGSVYLETADFFGTPRGTFVTDGTRFAFYRPDEHRFVDGPAVAQVMGRYLPAPLGPEELASALLGELPILWDAPARLEVEEGSSSYVLELTGEAASQRLRVGTRDLRLLELETKGKGAVRARLEDHDDALVPGVPFATTIRLELPGELELALRYTDLKLNPATDPSVFRLAPPPGAAVEHL